MYRPNGPNVMPTEEHDPLLPVAKQHDSTKSSAAVDASPPSTELYGYQLMALSTVGISGMSFFAHIAEYTFSFPPLTTFFIRSIVQAFLSLFCIAIIPEARRSLSTLTRRKLALLMFRGLTGSLALAAIFASFQLLPVGDAVTILYIAPALTLQLSHHVLGEAITRLDAVASMLSFTGVLLIARPGFGSEDVSPADRLVGSLFALACAVLCAIVSVTIRSLGASIHFITSVFALGFVGIFVSILLGGAVRPAALLGHKDGALLAILSALFGFAGQWFLNKGLQHCRAGPGEVVRTMDVPIAYVLGLVFLAENPSVFSFAGAFMIIMAAVLIGLREMIASWGSIHA